MKGTSKMIFKLKEDVNFPIELKTDFSFEKHINEQLREAEIKIFEYLSEENTRLYKDLRELNNKTFEIHEKIIDTIKKAL